MDKTGGRADALKGEAIATHQTSKMKKKENKGEKNEQINSSLFVFIYR